MSKGPKWASDIDYALAALAAPEVAPPGWYTARELSDASSDGCCESTMRTRLDNEVRAGRWERRQYAKPGCDTLRNRTANHYRPVGAKKSKPND